MKVEQGELDPTSPKMVAPLPRRAPFAMHPARLAKHPTPCAPNLTSTSGGSEVPLLWCFGAGGVKRVSLVVSCEYFKSAVSRASDTAWAVRSIGRCGWEVRGFAEKGEGEESCTRRDFGGKPGLPRS